MAPKRRRDVHEYTDNESNNDADIHSFQRNFGDYEKFELSGLVMMLLPMNLLILM
jgi:hypothetical protein